MANKIPTPPIFTHFSSSDSFDPTDEPTPAILIEHIVQHQHGGQLRVASQKYQIPQDDWIDLSTGISPQCYPLPEMPTRCWQRLPEINDGLETTSTAYYGSASLLAVSGSQEAIQRLPLVIKKHKKKLGVGIISPAYHSHQQSWEKAGHQVTVLNSSEVNHNIAALDVLIVVNPGNPSAEQFSTQTLLAWHQQLSVKNGILIVDEAFIDSTPKQSLITQKPKSGLIVLRSIGKFFGLAGIRLGFVWATPDLLKKIADKQDDWSVSHPARWAGKLALNDTHWQQQQRELLKQQSQRLESILEKTIVHQWQKKKHDFALKSTDLFTYIQSSSAKNLHTFLARQGILTRYFDNPQALRFGLPANEAQWQRLEKRLQQYNE